MPSTYTARRKGRFCTCTRVTSCARHCGCPLLSRKECIAQAEKLPSASGGQLVPNLRLPWQVPWALKHFCDHKTMSFDDCAMATPNHLAPRHHICSGLRRPVVVKCCLKQQHSLLRSVTRSAPGCSLAGWDQANYGVQYWSPPLVAYRVLVLPADPPLLSWPLLSWPPQETLTESAGRRPGQVPWPPNYFCDRPNDGVAMVGEEIPPSTSHFLAIRLREHAA